MKNSPLIEGYLHQADGVFPLKGEDNDRYPPPWRGEGCWCEE